MSEAMNENEAKTVEVAKRRAAIMAYINTHPGTISSKDLAEALDINVHDLRYAITALVDAGEIEMHKHGVANHYGKPGRDLFSDQEAPATPKPQKTKAAKASDEVELVMSGVSIVIGRNPSTGRLRITIE